MLLGTMQQPVISTTQDKCGTQQTHTQHEQARSRKHLTDGMSVTSCMVHGDVAPDSRFDADIQDAHVTDYGSQNFPDAIVMTAHYTQVDWRHDEGYRQPSTKSTMMLELIFSSSILLKAFPYRPECESHLDTRLCIAVLRHPVVCGVAEHLAHLGIIVDQLRQRPGIRFCMAGCYLAGTDCKKFTDLLICAQRVIADIVLVA